MPRSPMPKNEPGVQPCLREGAVWIRAPSSPRRGSNPLYTSPGGDNRIALTKVEGLATIAPRHLNIPRRRFHRHQRETQRGDLKVIPWNAVSMTQRVERTVMAVRIFQPSKGTRRDDIHRGSSTELQRQQCTPRLEVEGTRARKETSLYTKINRRAAGGRCRSHVQGFNGFWIQLEMIVAEVPPQSLRYEHNQCNCDAQRDRTFAFACARGSGEQSKINQYVDGH